jgi:CubicO group peptidase (beta-lactamase class C family)
MIIERVTGRSFGSYLERTIFKPLGMASTRVNDPREVIAHRASGYTKRFGRTANAEFVSPSQLAFADTALISTVEDLARWESALCKIHGEPGSVLPEKWMTEMWTPRFMPVNWPTYYGYGWGVEASSDYTYIGHQGAIQGFNAAIARFVRGSSVVTVIVLVNYELPDGALSDFVEELAKLAAPGAKRAAQPSLRVRDPRQAILQR